jgi:hypothetical protein
MANIFKAKSLISRTGVFSNEVIAPNLVYNTGEQFVSGFKKFDTRPTVNGTGVLLSGEAASLPVTIVYTTGNQTISGNKTFNNTLSVGTISGLSGSTSIEVKGLNNAYNFAGTDNGGAVTIRGGSGINYGGDVNLYAGKAGNLDYKGSINLIGSDIVINQHNTSAGRNVTIWKNGAVFGTTTVNVSIGQDSVNVTNNFNISGVAVLPASYATSVNLASTGSTLTNNITSLSGLFTGYTGNLDSTFASDTQLANTGSTLDLKINSLSGSLNSSGINLINSINSLSGSLNSSGTNLNNIINSLSGVAVLTYGNQNITGNKTFINNLEVQGTGIFNALDLSNISEFNFSGTNINLISGNVNISGQIYISGNPVLTGVNLSSYATTANLTSTGSTLATNLASTGSTLVSSINSLSGLFTGFTGALDATFASDIQLANTGSTLIINLATTGSSLDTKINNLSGITVLKFSDQTISGVKTFANTGSFNTLQITNKKLSSYSYNSTNFDFDNTYINIVNSSTNIIGYLPSEITSGINYYVKNLNSGILLITGYDQRTIDGFSNVNLYKNESLQLLGVNNVGYTGWITLSADNGVS